MRALLVDDDHELLEVLWNGLDEQGYHVELETSFTGARSRAVLGAFDVIVLDVMIPGGDGYSLCRAIRQRGVTTPVLMLTARDTVDDRLRGFDAGADDYVTKPFAFRELLARLRALTRRPPVPGPEKVSIADLDVHFRTHTASRGGRDIELTAKEFALLEFLAHNAGRVVHRAAITAHVWDENHDPYTNVLEVLVRRLRRKIDDGFDVKLIHTLRGAGYKLGA
jgi:two-component system copper resistance phosphate regulon response regulator CusR